MGEPDAARVDVAAVLDAARQYDAAADIDDSRTRTGEPTDVWGRSYGNDSVASNGDGLGPRTRGVAREDLGANQDEVRRLLGDEVDAKLAD